jgi:hypothetical protein
MLTSSRITANCFWSTCFSACDPEETKTRAEKRRRRYGTDYR